MNTAQCKHATFNNGVCLGCGFSEVGILYVRLAEVERERDELRRVIESASLMLEASDPRHLVTDSDNDLIVFASKMIHRAEGAELDRDRLARRLRVVELGVRPCCREDGWTLDYGSGKLTPVVNRLCYPPGGIPFTRWLTMDDALDAAATALEVAGLLKEVPHEG